jgi:hypothetical protein
VGVFRHTSPGETLRHNVGPITGRAGTEPRSTDKNYTAGPVRCIGGLCGSAGRRGEPELSDERRDELQSVPRLNG